MKDFEDYNFSGILPIFPLSDIVLFPQGLLPLHIFDSRYKKLFADALDGDKLIGMVLAKDGKNYYDDSQMHEVACMSKIIKSEKLKDGSYEAILRGLERIKIEGIISDKPYRKAKVTILEEKEMDGGNEEVEMIFKMLLFSQTLPEEELEQIRKQGLQHLIDIVSFLLPLHVLEKQQLLEELNVVKRARKLLSFVKSGYITSLMAINWRRRIPPECLN